jgi:hypothetical protein
MVITPPMLAVVGIGAILAVPAADEARTKFPLFVS